MGDSPLGAMNEADRAAAIAARLDRMPVTGFHHALALIVGAGLLIDTTEIYLGAGMGAALVRLEFATLTELAFLAMVTTLALAAGGFITGFLGDQFGRLAAARTTIALVVIGSFGAASAPDFSALIVWRAVTALGLGGETVFAFGMLSEFAPPSVRGRWLAWVGFLSVLGLPLSLVLGYVILPLVNGWRVMLMFVGALALGAAILRVFLVESPRWLSLRGRFAEAEAIVVSIEAAARTPLAHPVLSTRRSSAAASAFHPLRLGVAIVVQLGVVCAVFGFLVWLPAFFASSGYDIATSTLFAAVMAAGAPVGTLAALLLTDIVERKWAVVATALAAALLGGVYAYMAAPGAIVVAGFAMVTALYLFATLGIFSYVPEFFATETRMRAMGLVTTCGRVAAFGLPLAATQLFAVGGQGLVAAALGAVMLLVALVVARWGINTRARPLEAI